MRSFLEDILASDDFSQEEKNYWRALPHLCLADSIADFNQYRLTGCLHKKQKRSDKESRYITVILHNVTMAPCYDDDNLPIVLVNECNEKSHLFLLSQQQMDADSQSTTMVLWPHYNPEFKLLHNQLENYLEGPVECKGIFLCYDKSFDNAFITNVYEKGLKSIQEIMKELWPHTEL